MFSQFKTISRCGHYTTLFSFFLSCSRSSCVRCIHPSQFVSLSFSINSLFLSCSRTSQEVSNACAAYMFTLQTYHCWLFSLSLTVLHTFSLPLVVAHYCFCLKCTYQLVYLFLCMLFTPQYLPIQHGCRKVEVPPLLPPHMNTETSLFFLSDHKPEKAFCTVCTGCSWPQNLNYWSFISSELKI